MSLFQLRRRDPIFREFENFPSLFNRVMEGNGLTDHLPEALQGGKIPPLNISEDESGFQVACELPGMNEKDINVQLMGNQLVISGEKRFEEEKKNKEYHRVESQYGSFSRSVTLPRTVRENGVKASYKNGVLTVSVPKIEPTPAAKIEVKAG